MDDGRITTRSSSCFLLAHLAISLFDLLTPNLSLFLSHSLLDHHHKMGVQQPNYKLYKNHFGQPSIKKAFSLLAL